MDILLTLLDINGRRFAFSAGNARFLPTGTSYDSNGFKPQALESLTIYNDDGTVWAFAPLLPDADTGLLQVLAEE